MSETVEEMLKRINKDEFSRFEWRILYYVCERPEIYGSFNEIEMLVHTNLRGYFEESWIKAYTEGKKGTFYKYLMDRILVSLEERHALRKTRELPYGEFQIFMYERTDDLKKVCQEILNVGQGTTEELNVLLPKRSSY